MIRCRRPYTAPALYLIISQVPILVQTGKEFSISITSLVRAGVDSHLCSRRNLANFRSTANRGALGDIGSVFGVLGVLARCNETKRQHHVRTTGVIILLRSAIDSWCRSEFIEKVSRLGSQISNHLVVLAKIQETLPKHQTGLPGTVSRVAPEIFFIFYVLHRFHREF